MSEAKRNDSDFLCKYCFAAPGAKHGSLCERPPKKDPATEAIERAASMIMFRVVVLKQIHSCYADVAAGDAWMARELYLPFAPYPKLILSDPDGWNTEAVTVQWDGQMFVVYSAKDTELFDSQANRKRGRDILEIVEEWESQGWTLLGYGASPPIETGEKSDEHQGD